MPRTKREKNMKLQWILLLLALVVLAVLLLFRSSAGRTDQRPETTAQTPQEDAVPASGQTDPPVAATRPPSPEPTADEQAADPLPDEALQSPKGYTRETYDMVNDLLYTYRYLGKSGENSVREKLAALKEADPALGKLWEETMEYWFYANDEMPVTPHVLPDGLPEDDSLCIVVLGYQLLADGEMTPELLGRCQVALTSAEKYPRALIAVTGGGTAKANETVTEAGVMADWLIGQGIAPERILREDASLTTADNAQNLCTILAADYPQVKTLAVVTSDYHQPLACLLFTQAALLWEYETGELPYAVAANAGFMTGIRNEDYQSIPAQSPYVWYMADPKY